MILLPCYSSICSSRSMFGEMLCSIFYMPFSLLKVDRHVDLLEVAQETDGFSGSDLKEMCRDAALLCVREYVNSASEERYDLSDLSNPCRAFRLVHVSLQYPPCLWTQRWT